MRLPQPVFLVGLLAVVAAAPLSVAETAVEAGHTSRNDPLPVSTGSLPVTAAYRDGTLVLHYDASGDRLKLVARWPVDEVPPGSYGYRAARLEPIMKLFGRVEHTWHRRSGDGASVFQPQGHDSARQSATRAPGQSHAH